MPCPHGHNSTPLTCSQCVGAKPRIVTITRDGELRVNGRRVEGRASSISNTWKPPNAGRGKRAAMRNVQSSEDDES